MHTGIRRLLRSERGAINWLTTIGLLVALAIGYFGFAYAPHWLTNRDVLSAMREAAYQGWRVHDDDELRRMIRAKTDQVLTVNDGSGDYAVIDEGMIDIVRDEKNIFINVSYQVPMHLPGTQKIRRISFSNSVKTDLGTPFDSAPSKKSWKDFFGGLFN